MPTEPFKTMVHFLVETRDEEHAMELRDLLEGIFGAKVHWEKKTPLNSKTTSDLSTAV